MAQLIRRLGAALLAIVLALLALAAPAVGPRLAFPDARIEIPSEQVFTPIQSFEYLPWLQKQGPPHDLLAQVTTNPSVTGSCPPGTETVSGVGEDSSRTALSPSGSVTGRPYCTTLPSFAVALQTTLVPERAKGSNTPTFTRATTAYQTDFEGKLNAVLSGEARFQGAARYSNEYASSATLSTQGNTVIAGTYAVSFTGTGTITFSGAYSGSLVGQGAAVTVGKVITTTTGTLTSTVSGSVTNAMLENKTGSTNTNPAPFYVDSATAYGANVNGVRYDDYLNSSTIASDVLTRAHGAAINSSEASCAGGVTAGVVDASGPLGYLAEGARTNYALWSRDLTNAAWVSGGGGIAAAKNAVGADGTANSATTLTASGANGTLLQSITLASQANVFQPLVKRGAGTGEIDITLDGGTTWTNITSQINSSTFTQAQATKTAANPQIGFRMVTAADTIIVDMAGMQNGTFASTPIPTTTVAVARNADVLTYASSGNISGTVGTAYAEITSFATALADNRIISIASGAGGSAITVASDKITIGDGTGGTALSASLSLPTSSVQKIGTTWAGSITQVSLNGTVTSGSFDGDLNVISPMTIGGINALPGFEIFGTIRKVRIYPLALNSTIMQIKTTSATEWLGDPFWRQAANDEQYRIAVNQ